jgi:hypothetical protein
MCDIVPRFKGLLLCINRADLTCVFAGGYHVNRYALEALSIEPENSSTTRGMNS